MRMKIPITGTVKQVEPCIIGDDNDPIRLIEIDLGNVSWRLIHLDLEAEEMEIEVTPSDSFNEPDLDEHGIQKTKPALDEHGVQREDEEGKPLLKPAFKPLRLATDQEKAQFLEQARNYSLERKTKAELYTLSKSPRLKNPFKAEPK